ncbi:MAG: RelA/SpoT domain-containing protein [Candidatus Acidiferrum sp.]
MPTAASARRKFLKKYRAEFADYKIKAETLERFIKEILQRAQIEIHKVEARAKDPNSVHLKLLRKMYRRPQSQLTDKIGVRIITYYSNDVDRIVDLLRPHIEIDPRKSVDKRMTLGLRGFGYSSVHLVARLRSNEAKKSVFACLDGIWFEVQVRSILEHAWAEVEHEIVFKSGIQHPDSVIRRFAAIAGTLEVLGTEFVSLRSERQKAIGEYCQRYADGRDHRNGFDSVRLLGFLENQYPVNPSWRAAEEVGQPFPPGIEATCVAALKHCSLGSARSLKPFLKRRAYRQAVRSFATAELKEEEEVSHLALVVIAIALASERALQDYFPGMAESAGIAAVLR